MRILTTLFLLSLILFATNVAAVDDKLQSSLAAAARDGDVETVRKLIAQGADVNTMASDGYKPLHSAVYFGKEKVVALLIAKGADINSKNRGMTPLIFAIRYNHMDIAELLLTKGADPSIPDNDGVTPLLYARKNARETEFTLILEKTAQDYQNTAAPYPQEEARFEKAAKDYRKATKKPAFPEEARKYKVQAELSVQDKQFQKAVELYGKALEIAPWWPEGHFNRAMILGELGSYFGAMREMKRYLTLVPNAPNARAAQDKIYQWELKAGGANK